jgi:ribosomal protein S18 acetylase RimI-like enzyme
LTPADFPFALDITNKENWGVTERDLKRILELDPHGTFIALDDGARVGMASGFAFGALGWIGNVIVVEERRRRSGIGKALVSHGIEYLRKRNAKHIGLYTYEENIRFYENLGFRRVDEFIRFNGTAHADTTPLNIRRMTTGDIAAVAELDQLGFGGYRQQLLRFTLSENPSTCFVLEGEKGLEGFVFAKDYVETLEIGPLVSVGNRTTAKALFDAVLGHAKARPVEFGCYLSNTAAIRVFDDYKLPRVRRGGVMMLNEKWRPERTEVMFAFGFLDKG